jgi:hypothetical protein
MKPIKKVSFNSEIVIFETYNSDDYDRHPIDSVLYRKAYRRVSEQEWFNIGVVLDIYKLYEMPVHVDSLKNNSYVSKNIIFQHFQKV